MRLLREQRSSSSCPRGAALAIVLILLLAGCGSSTTILLKATPSGIPGSNPLAAQRLGFPAIATKNTTRVDGADPIADAAAIALAEYPSSIRGTHPAVVAIAPTDDWQAALASAVFAAPPLRVPILLSDSGAMPSATRAALTQLAPIGASPAGGAQIIRIGDVPKTPGQRATVISGNDPFTLAAGIDRLQSAVSGQPSADVVIASADDAAYAMPAAGWAAESGDPILFVTSSGIPNATRQALQAHDHPHIYILGPMSVIPHSVGAQLGKYGPVKRITGNNPASNSVAFATYRDPPCVNGQACAHVPGSFGWALRSPGHGYVLLNQSRPLDAAAAAPLSASGSYGVQLVLDSSSALDSSILNFFLNFATPGYTQEGPTAAVYNHAWIIGNQDAVSVPVQAEVDGLLEAVPQK